MKLEGDADQRRPSMLLRLQITGSRVSCQKERKKTGAAVDLATPQLNDKLTKGNHICGQTMGLVN